MSDLKLIVGNKNYSSWSLRPWLFLRHFGIPFREKRVPLYTEGADAVLSAYFSDCKVPVLIDGLLSVWDSLAILEYLSERYLDSKGWPAGIEARAHARSISAEMHSSFANLRQELPMNCRKRFSNVRFSDDANREIERVKQIWSRIRREYGAHGEWLFGDFCAADAMYAPVALRFFGYDIPLDGIEAAYVRRVIDHPDVAKWIESARQEKEVVDLFEVEP